MQAIPSDPLSLSSRRMTLHLSFFSLLFACSSPSRATITVQPAHSTPPSIYEPLSTFAPSVGWNGCSTADNPRTFSTSFAASTSSTQSSIPIQSSLNVASQYLKGISAGNVNISNPDPCGPPFQSSGGAPGTNSTCAANVSVADTTRSNYYGVQCYNIGPRWELEADTCSDAAITVCLQMSGQFGKAYQDTNKWIWTTQQGNCTFGYW